jgi:hypothetical protein
MKPGEKGAAAKGGIYSTCITADESGHLPNRGVPCVRWLRWDEMRETCWLASCWIAIISYCSRGSMCGRSGHWPGQRGLRLRWRLRRWRKLETLARAARPSAALAPSPLEKTGEKFVRRATVTGVGGGRAPGPLIPGKSGVGVGVTPDPRQIGEISGMGMDPRL